MGLIDDSNIIPSNALFKTCATDYYGMQSRMLVLPPVLNDDDRYPMEYVTMEVSANASNKEAAVYFLACYMTPEVLLSEPIDGQGQWLTDIERYTRFDIEISPENEALWRTILAKGISIKKVICCLVSIPATPCTWPLGPLIMATLIKGVSEEQWEAASIETSSVWKTIRHIILPQIATGIFLLVIIAFADIWNMVEQPLILISTTSKKPISLAFNDFMKGSTEYLWAGSSVYAMPIIVLYIIMSRLMMSRHSLGK